jgi:hypothetical protein
MGRPIADVLTLHASPAPPTPPLPLPPATGGTALPDAPPRVRHRHTVEPAALVRRRTLAIRHVSGHRLVALLEIVSPANKDRAFHVEEFTRKVVDALDMGLHVLLVDLFPPGTHDPHGMHGRLRAASAARGRRAAGCGDAAEAERGGCEGARPSSVEHLQAGKAGP